MERLYKYQKYFRDFLSYFDNPDREGLKETPKRIIRSYKELLSGFNKDASKEIKLFKEEVYDQIIILRNIKFTSMCEHHLLPFIGSVHIAYLPKKKITGISKLARVVEVCSKRLQIQERLANDIADAIEKKLKPAGLLIIVVAKHLCMGIRGVKNESSEMITSVARGEMRTNLSLKQEALNLIFFS